MKIEVLYPEVANLYGDSANIMYLKQILEDATFIETNLNNETGMYEVYNPITNEILTTTESEEGAKLETEFYKENPNYKAEPPVSPN